MVRSLTRPCWLTLLALFLFLLSPWLRSLPLSLSLSLSLSFSLRHVSMYVFVVSLCDFWLSGFDCMCWNSGYCFFALLDFWVLTSQWLYLYLYCTVRIQKSLHVCCCCVHVSDFFMFGLEGLTACVGILNIWVVFFFFFFWH